MAPTNTRPNLWYVRLRNYLPDLNTKDSLLSCPSDPLPYISAWSSADHLSYNYPDYFGYCNYGGNWATNRWWGYKRESRVKKPSTLLVLADASVNSPVATFQYAGWGSTYGARSTPGWVAYRHGGNKFNAAFHDGHVETVKSGDRLAATLYQSSF